MWNKLLVPAYLFWGYIGQAYLSRLHIIMTFSQIGQRPKTTTALLAIEMHFFGVCVSCVLDVLFTLTKHILNYTLCDDIVCASSSHVLTGSSASTSACKRRCARTHTCAHPYHTFSMRECALGTRENVFNLRARRLCVCVYACVPPPPIYKCRPLSRCVHQKRNK